VRKASGIFDTVVFLVSPVTMLEWCNRPCSPFDLAVVLAQPTSQGCIKRMVCWVWQYRTGRGLFR